MIKNSRRLALLAASALTLSLSALGDPAAAQQGASLNYENADLRAVADDISGRTGLLFVFDPALAGTVTIISPPDADLSAEGVWRVFQASLQLNGFTAVPLGDREYKIVRTEQALRDPAFGSRPDGTTTVTRIVPLRFVSVQEASNAVRGLIAQTGLVTAVPETNTLIVADTADNVDRVVRILNDLDQDKSIVRSVTLQNANAVDVADTLSQIGGQGAEGQRSRMSVVPNPANNQIVLRGDADEVRRMLPIVRQLDQGGAQSGFDAIYLNYADAEKTVEILRSLLPQQLGPDSAQGQGGFGPTTAIGFDADTNAVVVNAPPETQRLVRNLVARLDIRRPQVLIEAIVVDVSNSTARDLGVQYLSGGDGFPATAASFPGSGPNIVSAAGAAFFLSDDGADALTGGQTVTVENGTVIQDPGNVNPALSSISGQVVNAAVGQLLNFNGFLGGFADVTDNGSVYGVLLNALQSDANSNVLQTAHVMALDNQEAVIQGGENIPITTGRASGDDFNGGVFTNVEREDIGTILKVTPTINEGNTVRLAVDLEISSISAFAGPNQDIILSKDQVTNNFIAEDGEIIVIGGIVGSDVQNTQSKVPLLGDIPLLGNLFKGQSRSQSDSTLMIFIRPTIIRDAGTARAVTARKYDYARQRQDIADRKANLRGKDEGSRIDELESDLLGAGDFVPPPRVMTVPVPVPAGVGASEPVSEAPPMPSVEPIQLSDAETGRERGLRGASGPIVGEAASGLE